MQRYGHIVKLNELPVVFTPNRHSKKVIKSIRRLLESYFIVIQDYLLCLPK